MLKAYKVQLYPSRDQIESLSQHFGCVRHVYNWALAEKIRHYEATKESLSKRDIQNRMVAVKREEKPWLKEVNSQSLLATLAHLDLAFGNFFKGHSNFPKFKKKYDSWQSFQCPQHVTADFEHQSLILPKIKGIKAKFHRVFSGTIKTVTIKRSPTQKYFASILVEDNLPLPIPTVISSEDTLGLDVGLRHFLITSQGDKIENPRLLKGSLERLSNAQKILVRKRNNAKNRVKQKLKLAKIHETITNCRHDFIHQQTAKLVIKSHVTSFVVEDLNISGMMKNRKLSLAIQDVGWGKFFSALRYKCEWYGKNLLTIGRFQPSSKVCSSCEYKIDKLPLSVRLWVCPRCQVEHDRDINAAKIIRYIGLKAHSLGQSDCIKSSPIAIPLSTGAMAKDAGSFFLHGSQEAPY